MSEKIDYKNVFCNCDFVLHHSSKIVSSSCKILLLATCIHVHKPYCKCKKKLYPVRSDRHLYTSNLIISPCTTKSSHYFPLLFICQVLGKSTFILTNTHTTWQTRINGIWKTVMKETCLKSFHSTKVNLTLTKANCKEIHNKILHYREHCWISFVFF